MVLVKVLPLFILCWVFSLLCSRTKCGSSEVLVKFLKAPHTFSHLNSATFSFEALDSANGSSCSNCSFSCKVSPLGKGVCVCVCWWGGGGGVVAWLNICTAA
ncbi:hypothetical protein L6164_011051 [Bauhinia variegata]|uniref:Uncharacterized protein n=1 Tax=Bauhinia variegata TaxID=167791 RepID=A0ACB9P4J9_BAUVA|nr:hypothetical protein L6164_011051 [Bauhinia variegata]